MVDFMLAKEYTPSQFVLNNSERFLIGYFNDVLFKMERIDFRFFVK